ncbi:MAG: hypothetical protein IJH64_00560 [Oscillospiraceae bacterium]|nr:hypothetical protein [Oscillospiraceae bacterium]
MADNVTMAEETVEETATPIKTLANCTLAEFIRQTNKIRHAVADYYADCDLGGIMKRKPELTGSESEEELAEKIRKQSKQNLSDLLDACLDTNAERTVEIVGLMCFKTAEESAKMDVNEFFDVVFDLIGSERVVSFFTKMVSSGLLDMVKP